MRDSKLIFVETLPDGVEMPFLLSMLNERKWYIDFYYACLRFPREFKYKIKTFFQRLFNKGVADEDIWSLYDNITEYVYPRLKRFAEAEKMGYPAIFSNYSDYCGYSKEEYEAKFKAKEILGGETEAWQKILDEMLFGFEYLHLGGDCMLQTPETEAFYMKHFNDTPWTKKEENIQKTYHYYSHKPEPEIHPWFTCGAELPPERLEKTEAKLYIIEEYHYNRELIRAAEEKCHKSLELFAKYYCNLWD